MSRLHILIPVYNEHENIGTTLDAMRAQIKTPFDVTIIYDFPEDTTIPVARRYQSEMPIALLHNDYGKGVVNALRKGLDGAAPDGAVMVTMADGADEYSRVDGMMARIEEGYDVVCGSRYCNGGRQIGGPWLKGLLSRLAGATLHLVAGIPTWDATNSFKMYAAPFLKTIRIESRGGFEVGLEILVKAFVANRRITEVPTTWRDRSAGQSRFRIMAWLPHYLKWYWLALWHGLRRRMR